MPRRHRLVAGTAWRVAGRAQMCLQGGVGGGGAATGRETSGINSGEEGEERWVGAVIRNKIALREAVEVENFSMAAELRDRGRLLRAQDPVLGRMTSLAAAIAEEDFPRAAKLRGEIVRAFEETSTRPVKHNRIAVAIPSRSEGGGSTLVTVDPDGGAELELFSTEDSSLVISNLAWGWKLRENRVSSWCVHWTARSSWTSLADTTGNTTHASQTRSGASAPAGSPGSRITPKITLAAHSQEDRRRSSERRWRRSHPEAGRWCACLSADPTSATDTFLDVTLALW